MGLHIKYENLREEENVPNPKAETDNYFFAFASAEAGA